MIVDLYEKIHRLRTQRYMSFSVYSGCAEAWKPPVFWGTVKYLLIHSHSSRFVANRMYTAMEPTYTAF